MASSSHHSPLKIVLEGLIGAGKSTLASLLKEKLPDKIELVSEPVEEWSGQNKLQFNFLEFYYNRQEKTETNIPFIFQMYALKTVMASNETQGAHTKPIELQERSVFSTMFMFAKTLHKNGEITDKEYFILEEWFSYMMSIRKPKVDIIIYMDIHPLLAICRAVKRDRPEERTALTHAYLCKLNHEYNFSLKPKLRELYPNAKIIKINANCSLEHLSNTSFKELVNYLRKL